jgi:phosphatidylinositol alpha-mannosyltransferase
VVLYTVVVWVCEALAMWVNLRAFHLPLGLGAAALLVAATGLSFALPLTPGNVGVYQGICVLVLGALGIERDRAFAFGIGAQAFGLVAIVLLGLALLQREGLRLRAIAAEKAESERGEAAAP